MNPQHLSPLAAWSTLDLCPRVDEPGVGIDMSYLVDAVDHQTTPDQLRIEKVLAGFDHRNSRILHIGVGNSGLARRFLPHCRGIDGVTIAERELVLARSLGLPGYRVFRVNKYGPDLARYLEPGYHYIVDNNLASFACCKFHLARMLDTYRWALALGGRILTDLQGMQWVVQDARWRMTFDDLVELGLRLGLRGIRLTEYVYALER